MRTDILERKNDILQWIAEGQTKAYICKQLHCKNETLNSYLTQMGIKYDGQPGKRPDDYKTTYVSAIEYINNGGCIKSHRLKLKLSRDGIKEDKCELCGLSTWQGIKLPLELHHIDGNHFNNELNNLMILCPNCHSIQKGNAGANVGHYTGE